MIIQKILIHKYCGILSAYGLGLADVVQEREEPASDVLSEEIVSHIHKERYTKLVRENSEALRSLGFTNDETIQHSILFIFTIVQLAI